MLFAELDGDVCQLRAPRMLQLPIHHARIVARTEHVSWHGIRDRLQHMQHHELRLERPAELDGVVQRL
jgi:hypothetical protein